MTLPHRVETLELQGFRNISALKLEFAPRVNVISGDNGQGKTSVLEALYFLATSRSFRTERLGEACQEGASLTRVAGVFREGDQTRRQRAIIHRGRKTMTIDDKTPSRLSSYAVRTPVVLFHPGDLQLVAGGAALRRTLLDRIALFANPSSSDTRSRYQRAARERQAILEQRGTRAPELEPFEQLMAELGVEFYGQRLDAMNRLENALLPAFVEMAAADLELALEYQPGGCSDVEEFRRELSTRRERDLRRKGPSFGPQRDDLHLVLGGRSARKHASQGQQRVLTLALKVAELECVRQARGAQPLLLLDDVSSELDPTRTGAVYRFVRESQSQVFVTTTRPELFETPGLNTEERADFRLVSGSLQ